MLLPQSPPHLGEIAATAGDGVPARAPSVNSMMSASGARTCQLFGRLPTSRQRRQREKTRPPWVPLGARSGWVGFTPWLPARIGHGLPSWGLARRCGGTAGALHQGIPLHAVAWVYNDRSMGHEIQAADCQSADRVRPRRALPGVPCQYYRKISGVHRGAKRSFTKSLSSDIRLIVMETDGHGGPGCRL